MMTAENAILPVTDETDNQLRQSEKGGVTTLNRLYGAKF